MAVVHVVVYVVVRKEAVQVVNMVAVRVVHRAVVRVVYIWVAGIFLSHRLMD